ncbi:MAG: hypothetical protein AAF970_10725 [Bacteroidota bacterium]
MPRSRSSRTPLWAPAAPTGGVVPWVHRLTPTATPASAADAEGPVHRLQAASTPALIIPWRQHPSWPGRRPLTRPGASQDAHPPAV